MEALQFHCLARFSVTCSYGREQKLHIRLCRFSGIITAKVQRRILTTAAIYKDSRKVLDTPVAEVDSSTMTRTRQNIPTKKQLVDTFRQGIIVEGGVGYKQTVVIRSYEVGADKTATLESLLNFLQVKTVFFLLLNI